MLSPVDHCASLRIRGTLARTGLGEPSKLRRRQDPFVPTAALKHDQPCTLDREAKGTAGDGGGLEVDAPDARKLHDRGRPERKLESDSVAPRVETERRKSRDCALVAEPAKLPTETGVDLKYLETRLCECESDELEQILPSREEADPGHLSYLPLKLGLRLFTKASTPSFLSSVAKSK